ncbi:uncharacterized protein EV420DRAFT_1277509 [Desarmillaria tabescens]|uniref:Acetyl-CoA synthetase-like protein n=1 Tax=Armillaria tabescens TaxID=1929756 RepID=A0AA39MS64_ARMTA|nr:uncharacterized protein EV420DRAFT_1277509 [Desarmillaria tabescens]KAK0444273.1 hypothetical protein EV420DRAFT_1277509 [Desarmillaria tabescens]
MDPSTPPSQARASHTFVPPPLDGSLSLPEIYDYNAIHSPDHLVFVYDDDNDGVKKLVWSELGQAMHRAASVVRRNLKEQHRSTSTVVAILANVADIFSYFTTIMGILRAGHQAFPISIVTTTPAGIAHLLQHTRAKYLLVGVDPVSQSLACAALQVPSIGGTIGDNVKAVPMPSFEELFSEPEYEREPVPPIHPRQTDPCLILPSSGTTEFPKPIIITHHAMLQWNWVPYCGRTDLCGHLLSAHALAMTHILGATMLSWTASTGIAVAGFSPWRSPAPPDADAMISGVVKTSATLLCTAPSLLETWARNPVHVSALRKLFAVTYAGSALDRQIGDFLASHGVKLVNLYGSTEVGCGSEFIPGKHLSPLSMLAAADFCKKLSGSRIRILTAVIHSSEQAISKHPMIDRCVMFGKGRPHPGLVVEPSREYAVDIKDGDLVSEYVDAIWPHVDEVNSSLPEHSRMTREMIIITDPAKPFQYSQKLTLRKFAVLQDYNDEINQAYRSTEVAQPLHRPEMWDQEHFLKLARAAVEKYMPCSLKDDDDLFQAGCDSLQATWIRNMIFHFLHRSLKISTRNIPHTLVYSNPTIQRLGTYIWQVIQYGQASVALSTLSGKIAEMEALVGKYTTDFPVHRPGPSPSGGGNDVVLVTGTTGALGAYILDSLINDPTVTRVYALNRGDTKGARSVYIRHVDSFRERDLDWTLLNSDKLVLLEADLTVEGLGLEGQVYEEIRRDVTCIIHSAWLRNYAVSLSTLEPLISGTRRLIDLALGSPHSAPPTFVFVSSLLVFRSKCGSLIDAENSRPATAIGWGYAESKWVAESILARAAETTPLRVSVARLGQLSGGSNGCWSPKEWFPLLVRSGQVVGCIPQLNGVLGWTPVHLAARAIVEVRHSGEPYMNMGHPNPMDALEMFRMVSEELGVPMVPYPEWLAALEASVRSGETASHIPSLAMMEFYRSAYRPLGSQNCDAVGITLGESERAMFASSSMRGLVGKTVGKEDVDLWMRYWRKVGLLMGTC